MLNIFDNVDFARALVRDLISANNALFRRTLNPSMGKVIVRGEALSLPKIEKDLLFNAIMKPVKNNSFSSMDEGFGKVSVNGLTYVWIIDHFSKDYGVTQLDLENPYNPRNLQQNIMRVLWVFSEKDYLNN